MTKVAVGTRYSSEVHLWLDTHGVCHKLAKAGPDRIMLVKASEIPAGPAEIVMLVDGRVHRTSVTLPYAGVPFEKFVTIEHAKRDLHPHEPEPANA